MEEGIRLNKYISEAGICSRREADRLIQNGKVEIDGTAAGLGTRVFPGQTVKIGKKEIIKEEEEIILAFYKPRGVECTSDKRTKNNIIDYIGYPKRIYNVGRLDKDSEGLILLTNQGDMVNKLMRSGNKHEKEYIVTVDRELTDDFLSGMANGVPILDTVTRKCVLEKIGKYTFRIIITQGLNRQIRRMCEYFGYHVKTLKRIRILNITLGNLKEGAYRKITGEEKRILYEQIKNSSNTTVGVKNNGRA